MLSDEIISLDDVWAGLPAKKAKTLLFLIESRTVQIAMRSRVEFSLTEEAANERELAFFNAFALRQLPRFRLTIQHLERYATHWQILVPETPRLKAALIHALGQKYQFTYQTIPSIQVVLGLNEEAVQQAYYLLYKKPIETIFASRLSWNEKLKWTVTAFEQHLESIPPFWLASLVTVALGLPQAFLALPIAATEVGPLPTIVFLILLGIVNILTMACMAEAIGRSGDFRYGNTFVKQLATNYLGDAGSSIFSLAVGIRVFLIALACYIGLSSTLANFTHIPASACAVLLFFVGLYLLSQKSLNFTVPVLVLLAAINVSLILLLSFLALPHIELHNLLYVNLPFFNQQTFKPEMLQQVLGVSLMLYFGHVYVGECGKLVLPRDASASSLIWGSVAGTGFLTILFCIWVLAINGAIAPQVLAAQSGTVLDPLAKQVGPIVKVLGLVLVTLLLGMAWIRSSSLLINLAKEWFPPKTQPMVSLPCKQGKLLLRPRGNSSHVTYIGITYLGIEESQPRFSLDIQSGGNIVRKEIAVIERWEIKELLPQFPDLDQSGIQLKLEVKSADRDRVYLQVISPMILTYEGVLQAKTNADKASPESSPTMSLYSSFRAYIKRIWADLKLQRHFFLSISPLVLVLLLSEWLFFTGTESFTNVLGFAGVLGNSLVGGIFPVLLLISSRRKGELIPDVVFQFLNHPWFITALYSLFLGNLLLHGLLVWKNPVARIGALSVALLSLVATAIMIYGGAFATRLVIELRENPQERGRTVFRIIAGGKPKKADVCLGYADGEQHYQAATGEVPSPSLLRYAVFQLSTKRVKELKVWAYRDNSTSGFESLPALVEVENGNKKMSFDLKLSGGKILLPLNNVACCLKIELPESSTT